MAKQPKLFDKIDAKVEGREGLKTVWQAGKFSLFSIVAFLIQTILQLVLPLIFDRMATPLPGWLSWIINPGTLSPEQQAIYVVAGVRPAVALRPVLHPDDARHRVQHLAAGRLLRMARTLQPSRVAEPPARHGTCRTAAVHRFLRHPEGPASGRPGTGW